MSPRRLSLALLLAVPGAFFGLLAGLLAFSVGFTANLILLLPICSASGAALGFLTGLLLGSSPNGIAPPRWQTMLALFILAVLAPKLLLGIQYHQSKLVFDGLSAALEVLIFFLVWNKSIRLASLLCLLAAALRVVAWIETADLPRLAGAVLWSVASCIIYLRGDWLSDHFRALFSGQKFNQL